MEISQRLPLFEVFATDFGALFWKSRARASRPPFSSMILLICFRSDSNPDGLFHCPTFDSEHRSEGSGRNPKTRYWQL